MSIETLRREMQERREKREKRGRLKEAGELSNIFETTEDALEFVDAMAAENKEEDNEKV